MTGFKILFHCILVYVVCFHTPQKNKHSLATSPMGIKLFCVSFVLPSQIKQNRILESLNQGDEKFFFIINTAHRSNLLVDKNQRKK